MCGAASALNAGAARLPFMNALQGGRSTMADQRETPEIRIDVWSDYVCPFCYLELPVLRRVAEEYGGRVAIDWHAFELRPEPVPTLDPDGEYLHRVWNASVYPMARERSMELRLPPVQPRSRKAFEAAEHARERGRFDEMNEALFRAFFRDGRDLADPAVLGGVAASVGLDRDAVLADLEAGRHTAKVLEDERLAADLRVSGVPALLMRKEGTEGRTLLMSGAQPYEAVAAAVRRLVEAG
jgi:predicted DsbA family dithiol-disulfide isomerase